MSDPFVSEIRMMTFNYAPRGWVQCNGQTLAINQYQTVFALIGTTYGGNGTTTFALPNLQGRVPMHMGNGFGLGQQFGEEGHTLVLTEMPPHNHGMQATTTAGAVAIPVPTTALGQGQTASKAVNLYAAPGGSSVPFSSAAIGKSGSDQPHENRQPFLALNFCIALSGIFPSRT
jgi:microcystin-dependent protein